MVTTAVHRFGTDLVQAVDFSGAGLLEQPLGLIPPVFEGGGERLDRVDEHGIEERGANLEPTGHAGPVDLGEDVVREILSKMLEKYDSLPDDVHITVRSESEESIHKHNAFAERVTTLRALRSSTYD